VASSFPASFKLMDRCSTRT